MSGELKLYKKFRKVVDDLGDIEIAWFTTFNFNLAFFEKYILAAIAKLDPHSLRSLRDYEALNDLLYDSEEEDNVTDIRVFHYYRALRIEQSKKTCVQTFAIDPGDIDPRFAHGVFHPKVILLINKNGEGYLVTGSANLSLSAWASNSECIAFRKIEDKVNAGKVTAFFSQIISDKDSLLKLEKINRQWQRTLKDSANWEFYSSLDGSNFASEIKQNSDCLHVWSPYFSDDVPTIINDQFMDQSTVNIIPDLTTSNTVRISHEALNSLLENDRVHMFQDRFEYGSEHKPMVHAKVWLSEQKVGIGSWNFTYAGLNLSTNRNNIEAGIIQKISPSEYNAIIDDCVLEQLDLFSAMSDDDLQNDREGSMNNWRMSCAITADWSNSLYKISIEEEIVKGKYFIDLPGKAKRVDAIDFEKTEVSFFPERRALLKNRLFSVYDKIVNGEKIYVGVIIEHNAVERPIAKFDSIFDLIRASCDGRPQDHPQLHSDDFDDDLEEGGEASWQNDEYTKADDSEAWFTMFLAFGQMKKNISEATDERELRLLGYKYPGSVSELAEHLLRLKKEHENGSSIMSEEYLWFLINEGNQVIRLFSELYQVKRGESVPQVKNISIAFSGRQQKAKRWLSFIEKECDY